MARSSWSPSTRFNSASKGATLPLGTDSDSAYRQLDEALTCLSVAVDTLTSTLQPVLRYELNVPQDVADDAASSDLESLAWLLRRKADEVAALEARVHL